MVNLCILKEENVNLSCTVGGISGGIFTAPAPDVGFYIIGCTLGCVLGVFYSRNIKLRGNSCDRASDPAQT